jgi:nucleobase:cation symporter-1, NCS1 family
VEKLGIEHVDEGKRHGRQFSTFTLWFGANLTVADFALGSLFFGLPFPSIVVAVVIGNLVGGLLLGLMTAMGPTFGYPQMMISRAVFGKKGNVPFALATWISTVGWFTVNIILGGYALQIAFHLPFYMAAGLMVLADTALAIYGHDIIHLFERIMSVVLGIMFAAVTIIGYTGIGGSLGAYESSVSFSPYFWALVVAAIFSYLMSWSPYASDYTRYLPVNSSKLRLVAYTVAGGAIASAWTEIAGFFVYVAAKNGSLNAIEALASISGGYSILALLTVVMGALAADALNLYTNSLSALVLYSKVGRVKTVLVAGVAGFLLSLLGSGNFGAFYQNFLLTLDYWITPWIGVMLAAFFARKIRSGVDSTGGFQKTSVASYVIGLAVSFPFMNLSSYGVSYTGAIASLIGGADVSYFVAFIAAFAAYVGLSRKKAIA